MAKMIKLEALKRYAKKAGYSFRVVGDWDGDKFTETGILFSHEYTGPYPSDDSLKASMILYKWGIKHGYRVQNRGYYNGTAILV